MPVRIYDISKKLGLENKEVLTKAKQLGITAARVASSSLDKITAAYLEQQLVLDHPTSAPAPTAPPAPASIAHEPVVVVAAQVVEIAKPEPVPEISVTKSELVIKAQAPASAPPAEVPPSPAPVSIAPPPPAPPAEPPLPMGPRVGDKVGFIQLPTKPGPKPGEKPPPTKLPARPADGRGTDFVRRTGDIRGVRSPYGGPGRGTTPVGKAPTQKGAGAQKPAEAAPAAPKIVLPP